MGAIKRQASDVEASGLGFAVEVLSSDAARAERLARELEQALGPWMAISVERRAVAGPAEEGASIASDSRRAVFIDAVASPAGALAAVDPAREAAYLIVDEGSDLPPELIEGAVEDVLVHPFRPLEVLSKLRHCQRVFEWREASELNAACDALVERYAGDLELAEKLQKSRLPIRFSDVKGFRIGSRYLAGARSGGNYADLAESRDGQKLAIVLTDASNYRLSGAVLDAVPKVTGGLSLEEARSCITTARRIRDGVLASLGEKDRLSLFYGTLSRKDYRLRFVNLGDVRAFYASPGKEFSELPVQGGAIVRAESVRSETEGELMLEPEGRLVLTTPGFVDAAGGSAGMLGLLNRLRGRDAKDSLNELAFLVKSKLASPEELPEQDCMAVIFDVDARLIRLA